MREQRRRKALYVNRREDLYAETLLQREYAAPEKRKAVSAPDTARVPVRRGHESSPKKPKKPGTPRPTKRGPL